MTYVADVLVALAFVAAGYWAWAAYRAHAFGRRHPAPAGFTPAVSVLKPLCGVQPFLYETLRSFCEQAYSSFQLVFGVSDPSDPAVHVEPRGDVHQRLVLPVGPGGSRASATGVRVRRHDRMPPGRARRAGGLRERRRLPCRRLHVGTGGGGERPARRALAARRPDDRRRARLPDAGRPRAPVGPHDPLRAAGGLSDVVRHLRAAPLAPRARLRRRDAGGGGGARRESRGPLGRLARHAEDRRHSSLARRVAPSAPGRPLSGDLDPVLLRPHRAVVRTILHDRPPGPPAEGHPVSYLRTLFLHPPSYQGFDGGAGSRYQARREVRSFWYPTWLAQPAALVPGSRLVDAPPDGLTLDDVRRLARHYELPVLHTSTPSFVQDVRVAEALRAENPALRIGFVGAHVAVQRERALAASEAIDFVCHGEFDFTIQEVAEGRPLGEVRGLGYRDGAGLLRATPPRPPIENMDTLPFVVPVYARDLTVENYYIGYLLHPYVSLYTGRGCRSKSTFCLWPQTVGGQRYRTRSVDHVIEEIEVARRHFPQVKEFFFDDDTFTDDLPRAEEIARRLGRLGLTWSCNAKANVPRKTLEVLRENGLRLLLVGYESGNQKILNNIKKGIRLDIAREFT